MFIELPYTSCGYEFINVDDIRRIEHATQHQIRIHWRNGSTSRTYEISYSTVKRMIQRAQYEQQFDLEVQDTLSK